MWARVVEVMLSLYIIFSPFYYSDGIETPLYWVSHLICGVLIAIFAFLSFSRTLKKMHLLSLLISLFLLFAGYMNIYHNLVMSRSDILLGVFLAMVNIIPNFASYPPLRWIKFKQKNP